MDTKWKNKYMPIGIKVIICFLLAYVLLAGYDILRHGKYFKSYFDTREFQEELTNISLRSYFQNVLGIVEYEKKFNEGVDELEEMDQIRYEQHKKWVAHYTNIQYCVMDPGTEELFTNIPYLKNVDGTTETGKEVVSKYLSQDAIYSIPFPASHTGYILQQVDEEFYNAGFKGWLVIPQEGSRYSGIHRNARYYKSIQERLWKEGWTAVAASGCSIFFLFYLKGRDQGRILIGNKAIKLCEKVPQDVGGFVFVAYTIFIFYVLNRTSFFYFPVSILHGVIWTFVALHIFFVLVVIQVFIPLLQNKEAWNRKWKESYIYQLRRVMRDSWMIKGVFIKIITLLFSTALFSAFSLLVLIEVYEGREEMHTFLLALYVVLYVLMMPYYVMKKVGYFNKILIATEGMADGRQDQILDQREKGYVSILARNISHIQNGMKLAIESQMKSERLKTELIANVSHDLKTPLTSIISYIDLLKNRNTSPEKMEGYIGVLERKAQRLKTLIEDLFEASKMTSGAVELNIKKVDIVALLRQTMAEYEDKIAASSLTFRLDLPKHPIYLYLDGKKTWRVFENLISNILKYSHPDTRVYINVQEGEVLRVIMKNISNYEMNFEAEELFERFKRGDPSRHTEGSGLGLAIAKSIVELQRGQLNIEVDGDLFKVMIEFPFA